MKLVPVLLRFTPVDLARFDELARENGLNRSDFLRQMIREGMEKFSENDRRQDAEELKRQYAAAEYKLRRNEIYLATRAIRILYRIADKLEVDRKSSDQEDIEKATSLAKHLDPDAHIKDPT
jgi:hypothetical protein